ncbi:germ cell nuclear acidic protein [Drosophila nasuta]|uniref:germ cell nuclear acidic protein n=1 Tax=Drosophila nasuta TaxID=42062 RepID=UPI00295E52AB|nr:germ cell nuclear acidic protein [Drosophila nasuta]
MSDILNSQSFLKAFQLLNITHEPDKSKTTPTKSIATDRQQQPQQQDAANGNNSNDNDSIIEVVAHDILTCRMPQRAAGDADNSDDTDTDSDVIVVVDTSETSSFVSYIRPSDLDTDSDDNSDISDAWTIPETETENDSDIDVEKQSDSMMDKFVSTPIKRKLESFSNSNKKTKSKEPSIDLSLLEKTPICPPKVITTRSGRAVRQRIDHKFDYSSRKAQLEDSSSDNDYEDDDEDDVDDDDDADEDYHEEYPDDEDDDDDDDDYVEQVHEQPTRKQRRISMLSSGCSSSIASSSIIDNTDDAFIYVDLRQPVAIVSSEPTADATAVECDTELKMRLQKFLGLRPAQRRLYNPMANYELEDNRMDEDPPEVAPPSSRLWAAHNTHNVVQEPKARVPKAASTPSQVLPPLMKTLGAEVTNEMKMLLFDDIVQRTNANCFESQTPQHIKEPIDLSGLPSEEVRAHNCQQHKKITNLLARYAGVYSFLDSLRPETPLNMCHPLAVYYRKRDFESSKTMLAKTLFNVLNHSIFHCGLRRIITWKSCMNTPSTIVHSIEAGRQRTSRIVLWQQMKQPGMLVKALLHEMCHAAAFVYHGETGHGDHCRKWAYRAKSLLPELPQIDDCNAKFKYTCLLCHRRSHGIIKFEDEEQQLRCHYCQFEVNVEKYNAEEAHSLSFTDQLVTPYKQFVRENYLKCAESTHSSKMQSLNSQYKEQLQEQ